MQLVAMIEAGLNLPADQLALATASHSGEAKHLQGVERMLTAIGSSGYLQNTVDWPLGEAAKEAAMRAGGQPSALQQNCSGKHAAMLMTCVVNGWPTDTYLEQRHPLQRHITATIERLIGGKVRHIGVDGCGAPAHMVPLIGLARAFGSIATGSIDTPEGRVAAAMRAHPELVGGTGRDATVLMQSIPGLIAKDGAEGVYACAFADGRAVALKVEDGAWRSRPTIVIAALEQLGVDVCVARERISEQTFGHGQPVGEVRAVGFDLA
jgi:L-asparaginase II